MTVRHAKQSDTQDMIELFNHVFGKSGEQLACDYINSCFSNDYKKPHFIVKEVNNEIIGAAAYSEEIFTTNMWGISWVAVSESHRNKGYGSEIIKFSIDEIKKNIEDFTLVILGTFPNKTGLYDRNNFKNIFSDAEYGNLMIKKIKRND